MKTSILFFGSGPVAAKSLELLAKNFSIEAVVTKPKPAHHRGDFPVIEVAKKLGLTTHTVSNKAELSQLIASKPFKSDLGVLVDFGIIVSQDVIDYFPKGIVNSHFSLLPQWRGADPITFSILSGQKHTGVSLMLLVEAMDEGPILAQSSLEIEEGTTTPELTDRLIELSNEMLATILPEYVSGQVVPAAQDLSVQPTYSRKLTKNDGKIDWNKPAEQIEREIKAYAEWPKSYTTIAGKDLVITKAHTASQKEDKELAMKTSEGFLIIDTLKPSGKNEMTAKEFLAGYGKNLND